MNEQVDTDVSEKNAASKFTSLVCPHGVTSQKTNAGVLTP